MSPASFLPYLTFPGNAAEVFTYYQEVFGGELDLQRYGELGDLADFPFKPPEQAVAHAQLEGGAVTLAGGDGVGPPDAELPPLASDVYSFLLGPASVEDAQALITRLTDDGGTIDMPFELAPWGDHYGQVQDRFGVRWALSVPAGAAA